MMKCFLPLRSSAGLKLALRKSSTRDLSSGFGKAFDSKPVVLGGGAADPAAMETFQAWHTALDSALAGGSADQSMELVRPHMHPSCIFRPPTYFKPWTGREETLMILGAVSEVFGPSFQYGRQWLSDDAREWALEFSADIGDTGKTIHGIDLVSLNESGLIEEFTVLARPPSAVEALKGEMMKKVPLRLAALKAKQAIGLH